MELKQGEKKIKELFVGNCWKYLHDNFHKFNETNKIKIALEIYKKDIPQQIEGEIRYIQMTTVRVEQKPLELDFGNRASENTRNAFKANPPDNED